MKPPRQRAAARQSQPRGKTLLETVVLISIMTIVVGLSATSLATLFRLKRQFQRDAEQAASLSRLAVRLRSDAHEAVAASVEKGCVLKRADGRQIHYDYQRPTMVRQVRDGDRIVHHDTFLLPRSNTVAFERSDEAGGSLIRLAIRPAEVPPPKLEIPRAVTIEAAVGLNGRFATTARQP